MKGYIGIVSVLYCLQIVNANNFRCGDIDTIIKNSNKFIIKFECYGNGNKKAIKRYKNDKLHGVTKIWYKNGKLASIQPYKNYKFHGVRKGWEEDGFLSIYEPYYYGMPVDTHKVWYANHNMKELIVYDSVGIENKFLGEKVGCKNGLKQKWFENGQVSDSTIYKDDWPMIEYYWYKNGQLRIKRTSSKPGYMNFESAIFYDPNGKVCGKVENGNGEYTAWDVDGKRSVKGKYVNGTVE